MDLVAKFKKCHLSRESATPLPFEAMSQAMLDASTQRRCLHLLAAASICDRIVSAHTIQRSGVLQRIVDSTNHVRAFHPFTPEATGRLRLHRIGWREASTFTGFCARHDSETFRPLETVCFNGDAEQCFLVGYRALCHEVFQKIGVLKSYPVIRRLADRGVPEEQQREIQGMWMSLDAGTRKGLDDFQRLKGAMDACLLNGNHSRWCRAVVNFCGDLPVASTGAITPTRSFDGEQLQVLHDVEADIEELLFGIVETPEGGAAVSCGRTGRLHREHSSNRY